MRILHTSDWHLGRSLSGLSLEPEQSHAFEQLVDVVRRDPHDLLVVAGDVFDRASPSPEAVTLLGKWLARLREVAPDMPVVLTAGNHDNGARLAWAAQLLDHQGVYLRGAIEPPIEPIEVRGRSGVEAQVWAVPFLPSGTGPDKTQVGALTHAVEQIGERQDRTKAQVLVAHCFVRDGAPSDSERTFVGTATLVDPELFASFDYVALGHLHRPQQVAPNARYSGSLARYSFSEAGHDKRLLSVRVRPGVPHECEELPLRSLRGMRRIEDSLDALLADPKYEAALDDYAELTLSPPETVGNPLEKLRTRWRNLLSFRNDVPLLTTSTVTRPSDGGPRDLEEDFVAFEAQYTGGEPPREPVLQAFRGLLADLERKEGTE